MLVISQQVFNRCCKGMSVKKVFTGCTYVGSYSAVFVLELLEGSFAFIEALQRVLHGVGTRGTRK